MDMDSKNQYLKELRTEYLKTKSKKEKGKRRIIKWDCSENKTE